MSYLKFHSSLLLLIAPLMILGQEVLVLDGVSDFPLEGVALYNTSKTKSILTDVEGKAPLNNFSDTDIK